MKCRDRMCRVGEIDMSKVITVRMRIGCIESSIAHPCSLCGRLHFANGRPISNRRRHRAFLKNGKFIHIDKKGNIY